MKNTTIVIDNVLIIICIIIFFKENKIYSQSDSLIYNFVIKEKYFIDSLSNFYEFQDLEFFTKRIILNRDDFTEKNLFFQDDNDKNTSDTFKVNCNIWYFKNSNSWKLFFNNGKKINSKFFIQGYPYKIKWGKQIIYSNIKVYELIFQPLSFSISTKSLYYFSPDKGIIGMCVDGVNFIRSDIIDNK